MKNKAPTYWLTDAGKLISDPAARGFKETDCGPDMLCTPDGYCERVVKFKACFAAVDGRFAKMASTLEGAKTWVAVYGCDNDERVSADGITRFCGMDFKTAGSKLWYSLNLANVEKPLDVEVSK